jgi:CheY-like chemotaxis protein
MNIAEYIDVFESARPALEFINRSENDESRLILLDINMPEMNGFDFLDAYTKQNKEGNKDVVAMFMTTSLNESEMVKAQKYNGIVAQYVEKPLSPEAITELINRYF